MIAVFSFGLVGRALVAAGVGQESKGVHFEEPLGTDVQAMALEHAKIGISSELADFFADFGEAVEDVEEVAISKHFVVGAFALDGFVDGVVMVARVAVHEYGVGAQIFF